MFATGSVWARAGVDQAEFADLGRYSPVTQRSEMDVQLKTKNVVMAADD